MREETKGELFAHSSNFIWAFFPVIVNPALNPLPPLFTGGIVTLIAIIPFVVSLTWRREWRQLLIREAWWPLVANSLIIGVFYYALIFIGTMRTSPANAAMLTPCEMFFGLLFLAPLKHERISMQQFLGALMLVSGAVVIVSRDKLTLGSGDVIIVMACFFPPFGNIAAKKARDLVSSDMIMLVRSVISGLCLLGVSLLIEPLPAATDISRSLWYLIPNGVLLMGISKILWVEALYRMPIPKASALMSTGPAMTMILAYLMLGNIPTGLQMLAFLPIAAGVLLVSRPSPSARALVLEPIE